MTHVNYLFEGDFQVSFRLLQIPSQRKTKEKFSCDNALKRKIFLGLTESTMFPARGSFVKQIMLYRCDSTYHNERQLTLRKEAFCHLSLKNVITIQRDIPVENVQALYAFSFSSVRFIHCTLKEDLSPGPNECKSLTEFHYLRN